MVGTIASVDPTLGPVASGVAPAPRMLINSVSGALMPKDYGPKLEMESEKP